jgi:hypothetical protein
LKRENEGLGEERRKRINKTKWTSGLHSCEWKTCNFCLARERVRAWLSVYFPPSGKADLFYARVGVWVHITFETFGRLSRHCNWDQHVIYSYNDVNVVAAGSGEILEQFKRNSSHFACQRLQKQAFSVSNYP